MLKQDGLEVVAISTTQYAFVSELEPEGTGLKIERVEATCDKTRLG
jgi:hypothetical protein